MKRTNFIIFLLLACLPLRSQVQQFFTSDSLASITSPLGVDSLFYWFDAGAGVTDSLGGAIATDEGVGTWNDQSGNGRHVTQTTDTDRPVYKATGGPGSKPCIQFDGTDDFLASAAHFWGSDDLTVIVVCKFADAGRDVSEQVVSRSEATGNKRQWRLSGRNDAGGNKMELVLDSSGAGTGASQRANQDGVKSATWRLISATSNLSTFSWYVDGTSETNTVDGGTTGDGSVLDSSTPKLGIGATNVINAPATFLQGSISEIIVYSRALTTTERAAIENYLNKKYDLYALMDNTRNELLKGPKTPSKILTAYKTLRHADGYICALEGFDRKEIERYLSTRYTLYCLMILAFPIAGAKRRKTKNAA